MYGYGYGGGACGPVAAAPACPGSCIGAGIISIAILILIALGVIF